MELNPNHPVTEGMSDQWHKIVALLMHKFEKRHVEIDIEEITAALEGEMKAVTIRYTQTSIVLDLVTMAEGERLAREEGGLPV